MVVTYSSNKSGGGSAAGPSNAQSEATLAQTEIAKSQEARSKALWDQYNKTYVPVQNQNVKDAMNMGSVQDQGIQAGLAGAGVRTSFDKANNSNNRDLTRRGVNPGSGTALALNNDASLKEAAVESGSMNTARTNAITQGINARFQVANMGAGLIGASTNLSQIAGQNMGSVNTNLNTQQQQQLSAQQEQDRIAAENAAGMGSLVGQAVSTGITNYNKNKTGTTTTTVP